MALQNNLELKSATLRTETADINFKQSKNALLPAINGNYNYGISNGRSIDPFTNSYINEQLTFSNANLRLDAVVFNGFRLINNWKQQKLNLLASEAEKEESTQNLVLAVTLAYLNVMNTRDLVILAENRLESTDEQLVRVKSMFDKEMGNPSEYRDFQGQKANDESNLIAATNTFEDAKLSLMQLLNTSTYFDVSTIDVPIDIVNFDETFEEVYSEALQNLATVKVDEYRLEASEKSVSVAKALYVPEISVFANVGTNYSSAARIFNEDGTSIIETGDFVDVNGDIFNVQTEQTNFASQEISYNDQFENNLNNVAGIAVNIPIFNGFRAKNNVALEKIRQEEASVELERTKLQLRTSIEMAYKDMVASRQRYNVLEGQVEAYNESLRINEVRFNNGIENSIDFIISKNNYDNAQISLNNAKYEYFLRVKILEYYKGNSMF